MQELPKLPELQQALLLAAKLVALPESKPELEPKLDSRQVEELGSEPS